MKTIVLHDEHGTITSIAKIGDLKQAGSKFTSAGLVAGPGQRALEVTLSAEDEKRPLNDLHTRYRVDVSTGKLVKKGS
jgi:hypothetical protein